MKKLIAALLMLPLLPLTQSAATAQNAAPGGNAAAGKTYWDSNLTACKNCHGGMGEGAFGPDLAGRGLNGAQVYRAAHQPWGIMPAFVDGQLSQQQANDVAPYFASMPKRDQPGPWRFEAAASDPPGKQALMNADFNYFANLVYNHTTAIHTHRVSLGGNANGNVDMGNYNKSRVTESTLREIYDWAKNDIGFRAPMQGRLSAANGATYTLTVLNNGMKGKGVTAQGLTIHLLIPAGTTVVATTGAGYKGV